MRFMKKLDTAVKAKLEKVEKKINQNIDGFKDFLRLSIKETVVSFRVLKRRAKTQEDIGPVFKEELAAFHNRIPSAEVLVTVNLKCPYCDSALKYQGDRASCPKCSFYLEGIRVTPSALQPGDPEESVSQKPEEISKE